MVESFENRGPEVRYIYEKELGAARARLAGINAAIGKIIAWIDDDCVAEKNWLEQLIKPFYTHNPPPAIVGGEIRLRWENSRPVWMPKKLEHALGRLHFENAPVVVRAVNGANMAWRRNVIDILGDYQMRLGPVGRDKSRTSEDTEICARIRNAGGTILFTSDAIVHHFVPIQHSTVKYLIRRYHSFGVSDSIRYQYMFPGDRIDSLKRIGKSSISISLELINMLVNLPKRLVQNPADTLIDITPLAKTLGFLREEFRFQFRRQHPK